MTEPTTAAGPRERLLARLNAILDDRWPLRGKIVEAVDDYIEAEARQSDASALRAALAEIVDVLLYSVTPRDGLNPSGLLSSIGFYLGPHARTAVARDTAQRYTRLRDAVHAANEVLAALPEPKR